MDSYLASMIGYYAVSLPVGGSYWCREVFVTAKSAHAYAKRTALAWKQTIKVQKINSIEMARDCEFQMEKLEKWSS